MREVITVLTCDRKKCDYRTSLESPKGILGGYKIVPYPESWKEVEGVWLCPKCTKEYLEELGKFMDAAPKHKN